MLSAKIILKRAKEKPLLMLRRLETDGREKLETCKAGLMNACRRIPFDGD